MSTVHEVQGSDELEEMFCEVCRKKGRSRLAEGFCVDCIRYFCSACIEYHSEFLPNHVQKDKSSMPQEVCLKACSAHGDEIIKFYCKTCDTFFCDVCKENSQESCSNVAHLPKLIEELDLKEKYRDINNTLEHKLGEIYLKEERVNAEAMSAKEHAAEARQKLALQRDIVQAWLDAKYLALQKQINDLENKNEKLTETKIVKLKQSKTELDTLASAVQGTKEMKNRCEKFMSLHLVEKKIESHECPGIGYGYTIKYNFIENNDLGKSLEGLSLGSLHRRETVRLLFVQAKLYLPKKVSRLMRFIT